MEFDEFGRRGHLLWLLKIDWNERLRFPSRFLMIPDPMEATREAQSGSVVLFSGMSGFRSCLDFEAKRSTVVLLRSKTTGTKEWPELRGGSFFPPEAPLRRGGVGRSGRWAKNLNGLL